MPARPRLTPAMADVRRAVRTAVAGVFPDARARVTRDPSCGAPGGWVVPTAAPLVLVALSGGPDSLGLAAAVAFEAPKCGVRAGAVIVDHGLQPESAAVAERAAGQARALGLDPVFVERVDVRTTDAGPEADARTARYDALVRVAHADGGGGAAGMTDTAAVLLGHTLDDQAETVLLGLARGSGSRSLAGMPAVFVRDGVTFARPLLQIRRETVAQSCADQGLEAWSDPHNADPSYARVRVRSHVLPVLESELGPGVAEALARTASMAADDADALDQMAMDALTRIRTVDTRLSAAGLLDLAPAVRSRVARLWLLELGARDVAAVHVDAVLELVTNWTGQVGVDVPGLRVTRTDGYLVASV